MLLPSMICFSNSLSILGAICITQIFSSLDFSTPLENCPLLDNWVSLFHTQNTLLAHRNIELLGQILCLVISNIHKEFYLLNVSCYIPCWHNDLFLRIKIKYTAIFFQYSDAKVIDICFIFYCYILFF